MTWWPKLEALRAALAMHIKEEESITFANLEKELTAAQMADIAQRFETEKQYLMTTISPSGTKVTTDPVAKPQEGKTGA